MRRQSNRFLPIGLALGLAGAATARGQEPGKDTAAQIEELKKGQEQIRKEIQEVKKLLQARQAPAAPAPPAGPNVAGKVFDLGDNPVKGENTARLTLVEFTDYQ